MRFLNIREFRIKSYRAKTTTGKSLLFLIVIFIGYICGIISKIMSQRINYVIVFYCVNLSMVFIDIILYFRNLRYDKKKEAKSDLH